MLPLTEAGLQVILQESPDQLIQDHIQHHHVVLVAVSEVQVPPVHSGAQVVVQEVVEVVQEVLEAEDAIAKSLLRLN